jgi:SAM-dependent methyltransferase
LRLQHTVLPLQHLKTKVIPAAMRAHVEELPLVRRSILETVSEFAAGLPPGTRVLDAGAGDAPYADLFSRCDYVTADWPNSVHAGGRRANIVASLESLPVAAESFDAVLCTEVIEHVARPDAVLAELQRVLAPGGRICLTVPFVWPLHEEPFDFYRYTSHSLEHILKQAGFVDVLVDTRSGYLSTLGQVAAMTGWLRARPTPGIRAIQLRVCLRFARVCARPLAWLAKRNPSLDHDLVGVPFPLGYRVFASKAEPSDERRRVATADP